VFAPSANIEIDLGQAISLPGTKWNTPGAGKGVYDAEKWAVVFKFQSVDIPAGVTVTFKNHPSNPPVVWLVQGDCAISGTVQLNGVHGQQDGTLAIGGPGGFRGGSGGQGPVPNSAGFGPGGGFNDDLGRYPGAGSYGSKGMGDKAGVVNGNPQILPLYGGSGGKGIGGNCAGGGGGAILIVVGNKLLLSGTGRLFANGGNMYNYLESGSGGAVRLVANELAGPAGTFLQALGGGGGGAGRIRLEANTFNNAWTTTPEASVALLGGPEPQLWPDPNAHPRIVVTKVGDKLAPLDPRAQLGFQSTDIDLVGVGPVTVLIETSNIPVDGTWNVQLRLVPRSGADSYFTASLVSGNQTAAVWKVDGVQFEKDKGTAVLARAYLK